MYDRWHRSAISTSTSINFSTKLCRISRLSVGQHAAGFATSLATSYHTKQAKPGYTWLATDTWKLSKQCVPCSRLLATAASRQSQLHLSQTTNAAYVHLPFCKRRCYYCDFPITVTGYDPTIEKVSQRIDAYLHTILKEIQATAAPSLRQELQTVYFGGGTPSLVSPQGIHQILTALDTRYGIGADAEITLEADPGTFDADRLRAYQHLGVNRFSIGVQSFQHELLVACGRAHGVAEVETALQSLEAANVRNWSMDLISGLPNLTMEHWLESLQRTIGIRPPHVSVYDLQVEEGTRFARLYRAGESPLPSNEEGAAMYSEASRLLRAAGYHHYELSNYALPGYESRHNQVYWAGSPYYAFGLGAASYLQGRRFSRPRSMAAYHEWVEAFAAEGHGVPGMEMPADTPEDRLLDRVMLALRTTRGLDLQGVECEWGVGCVTDLLRALRPHIARGIVLVWDSAGVVLPVRAALEGVDRILARQASDARLAGAQVGSPLADSAIATVDTGARLDSLPQVGRGQPMCGMARVSLSDPDGLLLCNDIISDVFAVLPEPS